MTIYLECPVCHTLVSCSAKRCTSDKCGRATLPKNGRVYWTRFSVWGRKYTERIGQVTTQRARERETELRAKLKGTPPQKKPPTGPTWGDVTRRYMDYLEASGRTRWLKTARPYFTMMCDRWGDDVAALSITDLMVQDLQRDLLTTYAPASVDRILACGKAAWHYSIKNHRNPFVIRFLNPDNRRTAYLTQEEKGVLLAAAREYSEDWYGIILVALQTGMRKHNCLNLSRDQVNWERGSISIRQKGNRVHEIPLTTTLAEYLKARPEHESGLFFPSPKSGKAYSDSIRGAWNAIKQAAGIALGFRFHDLRHQVGTELTDATGNILLAKAVLGHADIRQTTRYAHLIDNRVRAAMEEALTINGTSDTKTDTK